MESSSINVTYAYREANCEYNKFDAEQLSGNLKWTTILDNGINPNNYLKVRTYIWLVNIVFQAPELEANPIHSTNYLTEM